MAKGQTGTEAGAWRAKEAAAFLGIGESTFWAWRKRGVISPGIALTPRTRLWPIAEIKAMLTPAQVTPQTA